MARPADHGRGGRAGIEVTLWTGFHAPIKTPAAVLKKLHAEMSRVIRLPDSIERLAGMGIDHAGNTPEEFRKIITADLERWAAVAKAANIRAD